MLLAFVIFFLILSFLVVIHELGHFMAAKKSGIAVHEFGFGLPPKIFGKKYGETEYTINALPIGGFVRIEGEDALEIDTSNKKSFINKSPSVKLFVLMAGVLMNIALAIVLYYFFFIFNNFISNPLLKFANYNFLMAREVKIDTAISGIDNKELEGKINEGDLIYNVEYVGCKTSSCALNSLNSNDFTNKNKSEVINTISKSVSLESFQSFINNSNQQSVKIYLYNASTRKFREVLANPYFDKDLNRNILGLYLGSIMYLDYGGNLFSKILSSPIHSINVIGYSSVSFAKLISTSFTTGDIKPLSSGVSGPIGIFTIVKAVLESRSPDIFWLIVDLSALISLSLALMNALPIPALDGGRAMFVLFEVFFRKKINSNYEAYIHRVGMVFLLLLIAIVTLKDFINLF